MSAIFRVCFTWGVGNHSCASPALSAIIRVLHLLCRRSLCASPTVSAIIKVLHLRCRQSVGCFTFSAIIRALHLLCRLSLGSFTCSVGDHSGASPAVSAIIRVLNLFCRRSLGCFTSTGWLKKLPCKLMDGAVYFVHTQDSKNTKRLIVSV